MATLRTLLRNPGFSLTVVLILALGIGANTAMFSMLDAVLLRPLAYPAADRLYAIQEVIPKVRHLAPMLPVNALHFAEWKREWRAAEEMALLHSITLSLTTGGEPERLPAARVSPSLFPMLGIQPALGRNFREEENRDGSDNVVILSDSLWQRRFHADPAILGQKIVLDGMPREVIGVLPPDIRVPHESQLEWLQIPDSEPQLWKPFAA
jgi:putative ABC transport system permease protein